MAPEEPVADSLKPIPGKPGAFRTTGVGLKQEIDFLPFYQVPRRRYAVYWDMYTPTEWTRRETEYKLREERKQKKLEAATIGLRPNPARCRPSATPTSRVTAASRRAPRATSGAMRPASGSRSICRWIVAHPMILRVTYSSDARRDGIIRRDGGRRAKSAKQKTERRSPEKEIRFFDVEYSADRGRRVQGQDEGHSAL